MLAMSKLTNDLLISVVQLPLNIKLKYRPFLFLSVLSLKKYHCDYDIFLLFLPQMIYGLSTLKGRSRRLDYFRVD